MAIRSASHPTRETPNQFASFLTHRLTSFAESTETLYLSFEIEWTDEAKATYKLLKANLSDKTRYKTVKKTIKFLASNPRHPSLQTHPFLSLSGPNEEKVFEAYAQQKTPSAYRVFWFYGPTKGTITLLAITPHP